MTPFGIGPVGIGPFGIRQGRDDDDFIGLIWACWSQYPGIRMDVDAEMPECRALASYYAAKGGALWAAVQDGAVVGMIAVTPWADREWEICRVYVHPSLHGSGLGHELLTVAEAFAPAQRFVLFSDTRFARAHRFYEKRSYVRSGALRILHDISNSLEFRYAKPRDGIEVLDAAAAESAIPRLSEILAGCVAEGAGVSFLPPLAPDTARGFWRETARDVASGKKILLAGWVGGVLAGTVTLSVNMPQNQPHRAEVAKLLVDPSIRRTGLARRLMARLEQEAMRVGRPLLMLDTRAGDRAEALYRSMGWTALGRVPGHALSKDGLFEDTAFFWKHLSPLGGI